MRDKKINFDYVFMDLDGVLQNHRLDVEDSFCSSVRKILKHVPREKLGVITNNPVALSQLNYYGMDKHVNSELIFQSYSVAEDLAKKLISENDFIFLNHLDEISKRVYSGSSDMYASILEDVVTKKPGPYMFGKAIEKTGAKPENCLIIGDSYEDILGGLVSGWKTLYLNGLEDDRYCTVMKLGLKPDYVIERDKLGDLETVLFGSK